ncbi:MAG: hypothetical protein FJ137_02775 [Deltaproteobacteria bacterium]|nr:hypothetical protein [Deltaproteobacteria bacterium]
MLQKFDAGAAAPLARGRSAPVTVPPSDEELFRSFVGDARPTRPTAAKAPAAKAKATAPGDGAALPRLSVRGAAVDIAARRLRAFLDDAVRGGASAVVVEVDAASEAALDVARGHAAVAAVHDASPAQGGKGARVLRLRG